MDKTNDEDENAKEMAKEIDILDIPGVIELRPDKTTNI
jgi:hypothetical protein